MPIFWENDVMGLILPDWIQTCAQDYETRMAQLVLLVRPDGLARLNALLAAAKDEPILVPVADGYRAMRIVTALDVQPKAGGWLRVSCDICFDHQPPSMAGTMSDPFALLLCLEG